MKPVAILILLITSLACTTNDDSTAVVNTTPKEIIYTIDQPTNKALFDFFKETLKADTFKIEDSRKERNFVWRDGKRKVDIVAKGKGIHWYYIKRQKAKPDYYYPDFVLYVFEFKDSIAAQSHFKTIDAALHTHDEFANGKGPNKLIRKDNELFYFTSGAEMFRGYLNHFAAEIEAFDYNKDEPDSIAKQ